MLEEEEREGNEESGREEMRERRSDRRKVGGEGKRIIGMELCVKREKEIEGVSYKRFQVVSAVM